VDRSHGGSDTLYSAGHYGVATLDTAAATLTYRLDNSRTATNDLNTGDVRHEVFLVRAVDDHGLTGETHVDFTINGTTDSGTNAGPEPDAVLGTYNGTQTTMVVTGLHDQNADGSIDAAVHVEAQPSADFYHLGVAAGDLNGDGRSDYVAVNERGTAYPNVARMNIGDTDGDGSPDFATINLPKLNAYGYSQDVALADMNGDGRLDVLIGSYGEDSLFINRGDTNADGLPDFTHSALATTAANTWGYGIAAGDINGDGRNDVVSSNWSHAASTINLNQGDANGDGTPEFLSMTVGGPNTLGVGIGDLNGDGRQDIFSGQYNGQNEQVHINLGDNNGDGRPEFNSYELPGTGGSTLGVALADLNGDGRLDAVTFSYDTGANALLNLGDTNGDGKLDFRSQNIDPNFYTYGGDVADIDGDGDLDIAIAHYYSGGMTVATNNGDTNGDGLLEFQIRAIPGTTAGWDVALTDWGLIG
jgi:VCBS repeat-containing protein